MRHPFLLAWAICLAGLWTGCSTDPEEGNPSKPVVVVPARIKSVPLGTTDTAITLLRYDSLGFITREIRSTSIKYWDSAGRYLGVRLLDSTAWLEHVEWVGADSTVRTQTTTYGPALVIHDRFFNRRPNCWCADSIRQTMGENYVATRKFLYDAQNNPVRAMLTWAFDGHTDVVQLYENTYNAKGLLVGIYETDGETGTVKTTIRFIEYDTLKNVTEDRTTVQATLP